MEDIVIICVSLCEKLRSCRYYTGCHLHYFTFKLIFLPFPLFSINTTDDGESESILGTGNGVSAWIPLGECLNDILFHQRESTLNMLRLGQKWLSRNQGVSMCV